MTIEEVSRFEYAHLEALAKVGLLHKSGDVEWAVCDECADRCIVRVERVFDSDGKLTRAYCYCEERDDIPGRIDIPVDYLGEWRSNASNLACLLAAQLQITGSPVELVTGRVWRLGAIRYAGQRADVFLAVALDSDDFPSIWARVETTVNQCSSSIVLVPGDSSATEFIGHKAKVLSLTRLLHIEDGRLLLDAEEIRRAAGIGVIRSEVTESDVIRSEDYLWFTLGGMNYALTTSQALVIKALHEAYQAGTYWLGKDYILEDVLETNSNRLRDTFKSNLDAWKGLIVKDGRGRYRLNLPIK